MSDSCRWCNQPRIESHPTEKEFACGTVYVRGQWIRSDQCGAVPLPTETNAAKENTTVIACYTPEVIWD
jgi:hypothetical protein